MRPAPKANREVDAIPFEGAPAGSVDAATAERARQLVAEGDRLFAARDPLLPLWQDFAEQFYVERADFTGPRSLGDGFADHLLTGYPAMLRQELASGVGGVLRPPGRDWFTPKLTGLERQGADSSQAVRRWLENVAAGMRGYMYEPAAMLRRALKQADHDYVVFGNACISLDVNWRDVSLLYRCWHLRDVVWREDFTGRVDEVHRQMKLPVSDVMRLFPKSYAAALDNVRPEQRREQELECRHISLPTERFDDGKRSGGFVSVYVDVENNHVMEAAGRPTLGYIVPRWQTVTGSPYGYSPPAVASVSDARMLQDVCRTLLEAGEKAVDPPMIATQEAIRSDLALFPGGVTYVDAAYDERLGPAMRPVLQDRSGLPVGLEMQQDIRQQLAGAWMTNKLALPQFGPQMTALEVSQRVQEYIRQALPLFEPIEAEYNGALCRETFGALAGLNLFGPRESWPTEVGAANVEFAFENPFTSSGDQEVLARYQTVAGLMTTQAQADPGANFEVDIRKAYRDAILATGAPASWLVDEQESQKARDAMNEQEQATDAMSKVQEGAAAAQAAGKGVESLVGGAAGLDPAAIAELAASAGIDFAPPTAEVEEPIDAPA